MVKFLESPDERRLSLLGPGDILGEMSLFFPDRLRSASARCLTAVEALEMTHADFETLLQRQPDLAFRIMREMTVRLRNTEQVTIRELQERNQQLAQAYQELKAAQAQLIEHEKNEYELALARRIQQGILPADIPLSAGLAAHHALAAGARRRRRFLRFHLLSRWQAWHCHRRRYRQGRPSRFGDGNHLQHPARHRRRLASRAGSLAWGIPAPVQ